MSTFVFFPKLPTTELKAGDNVIQVLPNKKDRCCDLGLRGRTIEHIKAATFTISAVNTETLSLTKDGKVISVANDGTWALATAVTHACENNFQHHVFITLPNTKIQAPQIP